MAQLNPPSLCVLLGCLKVGIMKSYWMAWSQKSDWRYIIFFCLAFCSRALLGSFALWWCRMSDSKLILCLQVYLSQKTEARQSTWSRGCTQCSIRQFFAAQKVRFFWKELQVRDTGYMQVAFCQYMYRKSNWLSWIWVACRIQGRICAHHHVKEIAHMDWDRHRRYSWYVFAVFAW